MPDAIRYPVAAGTYYVDSQKPTVLEAYLGTCVGAALYDSVAGVGGLIHILLPEPLKIEGFFQPEKYASTGFPLFLEALAKAGASAENMKACIAGQWKAPPSALANMAMYTCQTSRLPLQAR